MRYGARCAAPAGGVAMALAISLTVLSGCVTADPDATAGPASNPNEAPRTAPVIEALPVRSWQGGAMVAAANPLAVEAGIEMLRAGGSAVDAAIAVQAVLGLVEPQSSGIGGGAFLLHYSADTGDVVTYDGREVAPRGATADLFLAADGAPMPFLEAVRSGRSVGVPGLIAMLEMAHREHGRLDWPRLWDPAIRHAERGFAVSPRLNQMISAALARGPLLEAAAEYLTVADSAAQGRRARPVGSVLVNRDYAETLRAIAGQGARAFYQGPIAARILAAVAAEPLPGSMTVEDLRQYTPQRLEPICGEYRVYLVCGMRPPSSGGIAVLGVLGILENFDLSAMGPATLLGWHHFIEAQRLAYADRDMYVADDRYTEVPLTGLIDKNYLRTRAQLISPTAALRSVEAGNPPGATRAGKDATGDSAGTSHFVVVDARGNVVSMTTTVENLFGSQRMAAGFFLNNQLTDFSFRPTDSQGRAIANAVAPGKKPRSSMSPTIVFRDGRFELAVGSPGGNSIIAYVSKSLVGMLDWQLAPQQALDLPNVIARGAVLAESSLEESVSAGLSALGHRFGSGRGAEGSGLHAIRVLPDGTLAGAADKRREGRAIALP